MSGDFTPPEDDDPGALLDGDMGGVRKPSFDPALLAVPGTLTRPIPGNPLNTSSSSSSSSAAAAPFSLM